LIFSDGTYAAEAGTYSCDYYDGTDRTTFTLTVQELESPVQFSTDYSISSLENSVGPISTVSPIAGTPPYTYGALTGTNASLFSIDASGVLTWASGNAPAYTGVNDSYSVTVNATNSYESSPGSGTFLTGSDSINITINVLQNIMPSVVTQPVDQTVNLNHSVTFTAVFSNAVSYQWYKNSVAISGATSNSLTFTPVAADNSTFYYCVATSSEGGSVTTDAVILTVLPAILRITSLPLQDFNTGLTRANLANLTVRVKNYNSTVTLLSTTVTTDASGIFIIESDQLGVQNDTVNVEIVETDGSYTAIPYVLSTAV